MDAKLLPINQMIDNCNDPNSAECICYKIIRQVISLESNLTDEEEIGLRFVEFGSEIMYVDEISFENPNLIYFFGMYRGSYSQLIQHVSQLKFMILSVPKRDPAGPPRRYGFNWNVFS